MLTQFVGDHGGNVDVAIPVSLQDLVKYTPIRPTYQTTNH